MKTLLGIDVGGTNLRIGVVKGSQVVHEHRAQVDFSKLCKTHAPDIAWRAILASMHAGVAEVLTRFPEVSAVGIGFPGFIDPVAGVLTQSPNLPGLRDVDLAGDLTRAIGLPVIVENDAAAAAFGEYRLHPIDSDHLIYVGLGTGIGGGLIYADRIFEGQHGMSMEIGHLTIEPDGRPCGCGNRGCMEQYASATGVAMTYRLAIDSEKEAQEIAALAKAGDRHARYAFELAGTCLGQGLAHIVKVVDVGHVLIGGGMSEAWPLMQATFERRFQRDLIPALRSRVEVTLSASGDQAGMIGAALLAGARSGI
ncbi:MAG TPA: ROK family protein [Methylophilaceae bacterium]|nr:ROK family protein [Methylophilaceae bacterium]